MGRGDMTILREAARLSGPALQHAVADRRSHPDLVKKSMGQKWLSAECAVNPLFPEDDGLSHDFWLDLTQKHPAKGAPHKPPKPIDMPLATTWTFQRGLD